MVSVVTTPHSAISHLKTFQCIKIPPFVCVCPLYMCRSCFHISFEFVTGLCRPCCAECDSLSSFAHISAQPCSHTGPNVELFTFRRTLADTPNHSHAVHYEEYLLSESENTVYKKCSTTVLLPNLFDLYKSKGKRIHTALLRVHFIFTAFHFQCCCRATVGMFYKPPPLEGNWFGMALNVADPLRRCGN